jgi:hypothetical protein
MNEATAIGSRLRLQASDEVCFEAPTMEDLRALVALWRGEIAPVLYHDMEPATVNVGPGPVAKVDGSEEEALATRYREKFGKGFYYRASCGMSRLEALRAALGEGGEG